MADSRAAIKIGVFMRGQDISGDFTGCLNSDGSYTITGKPPVGAVFQLDDFNIQTARITVNGHPARQVLCRKLKGSPAHYSIVADVVL